MKSESIVVGIAGALFGLLCGWMLGAQQVAPVQGPAAPVAASAPAAAGGTAQAQGASTAPPIDLAAAQALEKAAAEKPDDAVVRTQLANLYFDTGIMARAPKVMKGMIATADLTGNPIDPIRGARIVSFELQESELAELEGIRDELGRYFVPAPA